VSGGGGKRRVTVLADRPGERLDLFLARILDGVSRKGVKKALDGGQVFVDGKVERRAGRLLAGGETVDATLDQAPPPPVPELEILFRDEHLLAVAKPPGLPAHPTVAGRPNAHDLVTGMLNREGRAEPPILLHRLDADTSGVLLFALTPEANRELSRQFAAREVEKVYLALVAGAPPAAFRMENHLRPGVRGRTVAVQSGGQPAASDFRTLWNSSERGFPPSVKGGEGGFSMIEAVPKTGRTHQIRAHLAGAGFPILGDILYGGPRQILIGDQKHLIRRHLLHALRLSFRHPVSARLLTIEAAIPDDFDEILSSIGITPRISDANRPAK
jgi:23S rRNA pseudouridine1911/1915/1917 synthase